MFIVLYYIVKLYIHCVLYNYMYVRTIKNKNVKFGVQVFGPDGSRAA